MLTAFFIVQVITALVLLFAMTSSVIVLVQLVNEGHLGLSAALVIFLLIVGFISLLESTMSQGIVRYEEIDRAGYARKYCEFEPFSRDFVCEKFRCNENNECVETE